jgi:hypothetical protein
LTSGFGSSTNNHGWVTKRVGVAITINGRLEKIDWYGHAQVFHGLWAGLLRAGILEALLEKRSASIEPRPLSEARFQDLLHRLETLKPVQQRPSAQALGDAWQFGSCRRQTHRVFPGWDGSAY